VVLNLKINTLLRELINNLADKVLVPHQNFECRLENGIVAPHPDFFILHQDFTPHLDFFILHQTFAPHKDFYLHVDDGLNCTLYCRSNEFQI